MEFRKVNQALTLLNLQFGLLVIAVAHIGAYAAHVIIETDKETLESQKPIASTWLQ